MIDAQTLQMLQQNETIDTLHKQLEGAALGAHAIVVPEGYKLHDLEPLQPARRRFRGAMTSNSLAAFVAYANKQAAESSACFVDPNAMKAVLIINLGTAQQPGHADHTATLALDKTAEFLALEKITANPHNQKELAEWFEDWHTHISGETADGTLMDAKAIVAAVRDIDVKAARNVGSTVQNLNQTRSTFESIDVSSNKQLPAALRFRCIPYAGLDEQTFELRLSALTSGEALRLALHIRRAEALKDARANNFAEIVRKQLPASTVYVGTFATK